jgi:hypothetical protein
MSEERTKPHRAGMGRKQAAIGICVAVAALALAAPASAGTYSASQCASGASVSPGWSTYGIHTNASTTLSNDCSSGGSIGDFVFSDGLAGAVTESGNEGSQVVLALVVPSSAPDVTIQAVHAQVLASSVTGDDAFLGFSSAGQSLPGLVELPYGGGEYANTEQWTLPQGARDFETFVNCTTDRSSTSCVFANATAVPALNNVGLTLSESVAPTVASASGTLASAAAARGSVAGSQALSFSARDADSGVRSATLSLTPSDGGVPVVHTFDFGSECAYDAWNACPATETVGGYAVDTAALSNGEYAVELSVADAAGNVVNDALGSVRVDNPSNETDRLGALPGPGTTDSAPLVTGSPNGAGASEAARLTLGLGGIVERDLPHSALRLAGRLLNNHGEPIASANLQVIQQRMGQAPELLGRALTASDGTFVVPVPRGTSRQLEVAYRAFPGDASYAAQASVKEAVSASVHLRISPRQASSTGKIILAGTVHGPIPPGGVIVDLLVHYRGRWVPFRTPQTDARGHFKVIYDFEGGVGTFPFCAKVPGGQSGFPYAAGRSRVVDVSAH